MSSASFESKYGPRMDQIKFVEDSLGPFVNNLSHLKMMLPKISW